MSTNSRFWFTLGILIGSLTTLLAAISGVKAGLEESRRRGR